MQIVSSVDVANCYVDINECEEDLVNCTENSQCVNLIGSFVCICNHGYHNNGTNCCMVEFLALSENYVIILFLYLRL